MDMGWVQHQQDIEDGINILTAAMRNGEENVTIEFETDIDDEERDMMYRVARARYLNG